MISRSLSTSERYARLHETAGRLAEFCQSLYPLIVAHADDYGRLPGDTFTIKHAIVPTSPRRLEDVERALQALDAVGLIIRYKAGDRDVIQIHGFDTHQSGLKRRTASEFPAPEGHDQFSATERDVEEFLAGELLAGRLLIGGLRCPTVTRQARVGNSYIDIVATSDCGMTFVIEVKRQRVTAAALNQVLGYVGMLPAAAAVPVVIGHGIAPGLTTTGTGVLIGTYSESMHVATVTSLNVMHREMTFSHMPLEGNRTEEKGIEGNRTERNSACGTVLVTAPTERDPVAPEGKIEAFVQLWNETTSRPLARCHGLSDKRKSHIRARLRDRGLSDWRDVFLRIERSSFCRGQNDRKWIASFDWIIESPDNALKVLEGKYDDRGSPRVKPTFGEWKPAEAET